MCCRSGPNAQTGERERYVGTQRAYISAQKESLIFQQVSGLASAKNRHPTEGPLTQGRGIQIWVMGWF